MNNLHLDDAKEKRAQAAQAIRRNWRQLITELAAPAKRNVNGERSYICPICGHGKGGDGLTRNPKSKDGNGLKCFGCNFSGDIIDLYKTVNNCDFNEALNYLAAELNINLQPDAKEGTPQKNDRAEARRTGETDTRQSVTPLQAKTPENAAESATAAPLDFSAYYKACSCGNMTAETHPEAISYIQARGISAETAAAFKIGYDPAADPASAPGATGREYKAHPEARLIIPCTDKYYVPRAINPAAALKAPNPKGSHPDLFNADALYSGARFIFICEGVFDALAIIESGWQAIALNGKGNGRLLKNKLRERATGASFIIVPDNDTGETRAQTSRQAQELERDLSAAGYRVKVCELPATAHDANELLTQDPAGLKEYILNSVTAFPDDITNFLDKIQAETYKPHATGLKFFDNLLGGGLLAQTLTLLLAAPGAGKTTLLAQVSETLAANNTPVIYLNLEMSQEQMLAKAISARLNQKGHDYTSADILQGYRWTDHDRQIITEEIETYRREQYPFIKYNPEKVGTDLDRILNHIRTRGAAALDRGQQAPAVVLDYLHLVTSGDLDTQERIKKIVTGLKQYAIDFNTFALAITAVNRQSMNSGRIALSDARDSSNIEYTADIQISLNWQAVDSGEIEFKDPVKMAELQLQPYQKMILRVLKNRGTEPGRSSKIIFDAAHNTFYSNDDFIKHNGETPFKNEPEEKTFRF